MRKNFFRIASPLFLSFGLFIFNCAAQVTTPTANEKPATAATDKPSGVMTPQTQDNTRRYRVGVSDEISIEVFRHPEYSTSSIKISENGLIVLPRIQQPVQAVCKTENDLSAEITELYKKILKQPFVRVRILSYQSQPVAVIGAVDKPGQFNLNRKMRLLEAVAIAGGPSKEAGARISLARLGTGDLCENPQTESEEQDLSKLLYAYNLKKTLEGDTASNPWIQPGDVVTILEADRAFVVGNVKEAKAILLRTPRTVTQAIAEAGGLEAASKKRQVVVIRTDDAGNKTKIPVDLIAIAQGKQEDPFLKPNDIIEVPVDGNKKLRNGFIDTFTKGLPSVLPFLF